jgi:hypothetical protein
MARLGPDDVVDILGGNSEMISRNGQQPIGRRKFILAMQAATRMPPHTLKSYSNTSSRPHKIFPDAI